MGDIENKSNINLKIVDPKTVTNAGGGGGDEDTDADIYANIGMLYQYLQHDPEFVNMVASRDFTTIKITCIPSVDSVSALIKEIAWVVSRNRNRTLTNRKANYLIFEFGLKKFETELAEIIRLKKLCSEIGIVIGVKCTYSMFGSGVGKGSESVLLYGHTENKLLLNPSFKQGERINALRDSLSGDFENRSIGLVCLVYAFNSAYNTGFINRNIEGMELLKYYYADDGLLKVVREYYSKYRENLLSYINEGLEILVLKKEVAEEDDIFINVYDALIEKVKKVII